MAKKRKARKLAKLTKLDSSPEIMQHAAKILLVGGSSEFNLNEEIAKELNPLLEKYAEGTSLTSEELAILNACPNTLTCMGYDYLNKAKIGNFALDFPNYLKDQGFVRGVTSRKEETKKVREFFAKLSSGKITPLETKAGSDLAGVAQPSMIASVSKFLLNVAKTGKMESDEATRFKDGATKLFQDQLGCDERKSKALGAALVRDHPFVEALLSGEEKEYIAPMVVGGALKGLNGKPLMEDMQALLKLEREAKKLAKDAKTMSVKDFFNANKDKLPKIQESFLDLVQKHSNHKSPSPLIAANHSDIGLGVVQFRVTQAARDLGLQAISNMQQEAKKGAHAKNMIQDPNHQKTKSAIPMGNLDQLKKQARQVQTSPTRK